MKTMGILFNCLGYAYWKNNPITDTPLTNNVFSLFLETVT